MKHAYIKFTTAMLEFFPTFSFSMAFGQICLIASKRFNFNTINWVDGHHMTYEEYTSWRILEVKTTNDIIHVKPIYHFVYMIQKTGVFIFIMFWYFDHVLSSNRGVGYSLYFPFQKSYWQSVFPCLQKPSVTDDGN